MKNMEMPKGKQPKMKATTSKQPKMAAMNAKKGAKKTR